MKEKFEQYDFLINAYIVKHKPTYKTEIHEVVKIRTFIPETITIPERIGYYANIIYKNTQTGENRKYYDYVETTTNSIKTLQKNGHITSSYLQALTIDKKYKIQCINNQYL